MTLTRHDRFARLPGAFTRILGDPVTITTATGDREFTAIIREKADVLNEFTSGAGTAGEYAALALATSDAAYVAEGDTLTHQAVNFKVASPGSADGRGMTRFDLMRTE